MTFNESNTVEAFVCARLAGLFDATNVRPLGLI